MEEYYVVFEYTAKAGGYAGVRTFTGYNDESDFNKHRRLNNSHERIVAKGVTLEKAQELTALTPEFSRLTVIVEEACYAEDGHVDTNFFQHHLMMAIYALKHDHEMCEQKGLKPLTDFPVVEVGPENTDKNQLLRYLKQNFLRKDGTIPDLEFAIQSMIEKAFTLSIAKLHLGK